MAIMAAIVKREKRTLYRVFPYWRINCSGPKPINRPENTAEMRIPVPDADSQLSWKIAGSAVGLATTGGMRKTRLCSPLIGILKIERPSRKFLTVGSPHKKISTLRITQGVQAFST